MKANYLTAAVRLALSCIRFLPVYTVACDYIQLFKLGASPIACKSPLFYKSSAVDE